jgi:protein gp37
MPHPNVWLGVTVEDQQRADERIPILLQIPAAKRFVSYEPALGAVDFSPYFRCRGCGYTAKDKFEQMDHLLCKNPTGTLDQIIAGEETGPHARRPKPEWFSDVIRQCRSAGVPIFIKKAPEGVEIIREFPK